MKKRPNKIKRQNLSHKRKKRPEPDSREGGGSTIALPLFLQKKSLISLAIAGVALFFVLIPQNEINEFHYYLYASAAKPARGCLPGPYSSFKGEEKDNCATAMTATNKPLKNKIVSIVKNTPMERMVDAITDRERSVAAYLVGIAMKESKFGIYSPKKNGADCYNYWGYRGKENTTASGYSCFDSPEHAIKVVGDRIESMVKRGARNPAEMISWKCGSTCAGHDPESVRKWIADVGINYYRINPSEQIAKNK